MVSCESFFLGGRFVNLKATMGLLRTELVGIGIWMTVSCVWVVECVGSDNFYALQNLEVGFLYGLETITGWLLTVLVGFSGSVN